MKLRFLALVLGLAMLLPTAMRADEGMWLLSLLGKNYADMQKKGFKLTPEDIYNVNQSCIKDAIIGLGNEGQSFWHFCTAEIISDKGLVSTNHHCGYGVIQAHSTVEHDYLRDGFWAYSLEEELPNPGTTASILIRIEDVTPQIKSVLKDDMTEAERNNAINEKAAELEKAAVEGTYYEAKVKSMFNGNQFIMFVHVIYKDVRLVGAPPSSIHRQLDVAPPYRRFLAAAYLHCPRRHPRCLLQGQCASETQTPPARKHQRRGTERLRHDYGFPRHHRPFPHLLRT